MREINIWGHVLSHSGMSDSLRSLWTVAHQAPLSMGFFRHEYWNEVKWKLLSRINSLQLHGLCNPWNSPGPNTRVGSHSLLQGIFQPRNGTQVSHIASRFFTRWAIREYWSGLPFPPPSDLPHPGIKLKSPVSPALEDRFFTTEPPGNNVR